MSAPVVHTEQLSIGYPGPKVVQANLNLELHTGQLVGLIGPNGCGKSTLMRTLGGLQTPLNGTVRLNNQDLQKLSLNEIARTLSIVTTERIGGNFSITELVALGRLPYTAWHGKLSDLDAKAVQDAIEKTGLQSLKDRKLPTLSDGQRQRAMIARALAQDTSIILLDEPTAHLDLPTRVETMLLLQKLAHDLNKTIIISTHELDLVMQFSDQLWVLSEEHAIATGTPEDLALQNVIGTVFDSNQFSFAPDQARFIVQQEKGKAIQVEGPALEVLWTQKALQRKGFDPYALSAERIITVAVNDTTTWKLEDQSFQSIEALLNAL